ncbi:hypothetical protein PVIIG_05420 [Plasmodium vivax India VII]|uniref:PIR Superfamily Protein n=1 Tax=Plasmodium vivax India VII TaxID=1077284 RepID=A0A0J9S3M1_PLAVI|nr:hypothetical protein PVIIG_05420 [Plasmodium vivax India VII]
MNREHKNLSNYSEYCESIRNEAIKKIPEIDLYYKLSDVEYDNIQIYDYLRECQKCQNSFRIEEFIRKIIKNYDDYKDKLNDNSNYNNYCRYFMYWLYKEKNLYIAKQGSQDTWNNCIPCIWNMLEKKRGDSGKKCEFENVIDSFATVQIIKIIDDMCIINTKTKLLNDITSDREKCLEFNKISKNYLVQILGHLLSIRNNISWKEAYFKIKKICSDGKIYNLFAERVCPSEESTKAKELECSPPQPIIPQTCSPHTCNNLKDLCQQQYATPKCDNLDELCKGRCTSQPPHDLKILCPEYCAENPISPVPTNEGPVNPAKNPYLQLPVTVFSSVVGTIFFFLFLYKVKDITF